MEFKKEELIKSPLNYTGGKFKLLPQILPLLPDDIDTFVDLFAGGCNVGINVKANKIVCNDIESHIISLLKYFKSCTSEELINNIEKIINDYQLSDTNTYGYEYYGCNSSDGVAKYNKEKYLKLRDDYNKDTSNNLLFYIVLIFAFNNEFEFNAKGKFNMSVGKRDFNKNMQNKLQNFILHLNNKFIFTNNDFSNLDINSLHKDDLVYCDPPYLITDATYKRRINLWTKQKERELLNLLDRVNNKGIKFALSNVLENKGRSNDILKEWSKQYNVHHLNNTYGNCNYHAKDKSKNTTDEVLITNY